MMSRWQVNLTENRGKRILQALHFWHSGQKNVERPARVILVMGVEQTLQGLPCLP